MIYRHGIPSVREPDQKPDRWFEPVNAFDANHLRWTYRYLRRRGLDADDARMAIHSAFHVGVRAAIRERAS